MSAINADCVSAVANTPAELDADDVGVQDDAAPVAALPAEITENADLLDEGVPVGSAAPTDADIKKWLDAHRALTVIEGKAKTRGHVANWIKFAMAFLLYLRYRAEQFNDLLSALGYRVPGSNHKFACAASAIYFLDTALPDNNNANSKRVTSLCSTFDGLQLELTKRGVRREALTLSRDSVRQLAQIIAEAGGTNALEHASKTGDDDETPVPISLNAEKKSSVLYERALEAMRGRGEPTVKVTVEAKYPDGSTVVFDVAETLKERAVADLAKPHPRTQACAEMLVVGSCVLVEETEQVKRPGTDPNDPRTERRTAERQVVFHPDDRITQSLSGVTSSVVVDTRTHVPNIILGVRVPGHTRLDTFLRKRIEANILAEERRAVFELDVVGTDMASGVGRLMVSTMAASDDSKGKDRFGALLQHLTGPVPIDVSPHLTYNAQGEAVPAVFHSYATSYAENAIKAVKSAVRQAKSPDRKTKRKTQAQPDVRIAMDGGELTSKSGAADAKESKVAVNNVQGSGSVSVRLDDYVAFLRAFDAVYPEVNREVVCRVGDDGVCFEIGTQSAVYRVFIPQSVNGVRMNGGFQKIIKQEWPEGAALTPNGELV